MKKKKVLIGLGVVLALALCVISCGKLSTKHCSDAKPYYCKDAKACCSYRYNDNHGTCWETMDGCRSSGYACTTCHLED